MTGGGRIVLTRAADAAAAWREKLTALGFAARLLPLLQHHPLPVPDAVRRQRFDWILFTSPRAVRMFAAAGIDPHAARIGAVGEATRMVLNEHGLSATLVPVEQDGAGLARVFCTRVKATASVLLPGPSRRLPEPRRSLELAGHCVTELPLYVTEPVPPAALPEVPCGPEDVVFFASPSAVRAWAAAWGTRPRCVAIGPTTAAACRAAGFRPRVAATPDLEAMVRAAGLVPTVPRKES